MSRRSVVTNDGAIATNCHAVTRSGGKLVARAYYAIPRHTVRHVGEEDTMFEHCHHEDNISLRYYVIDEDNIGGGVYGYRQQTASVGATRYSEQARGSGHSIPRMRRRIAIHGHHTSSFTPPARQCSSRRCRIMALR